MKNVKKILEATGRIPVFAINSASKLHGEDEALWKYFISKGTVDESDVFRAYAKVNRLQFVNLRTKEVQPHALSMLSPAFCRKEKLIPIEYRDSSRQLVIATSSPDNFEAIDEIVASKTVEVVIAIAAPSDLQEALDRYLRTDQEIDKLSEEIEQAVQEEEDESDLTELDDESPVVRFANLIIRQAIQDRASDIHVEPGEKTLRVRYRIDGVLKEVQSAESSIQKGIVSRLKVMSNIDIGERRKPQDGRLSVNHEGKTIDVRVVTLPTTWGEKVVMRILDHSNERRSISTIEMSPENEKIFTRCISRSHGMILVTGPTGSGKALPLNTKIPTPFGFTTMREISEKDKVFGSDGKVYPVTSVSEINDFAEMFKVTFSDGQTQITDGDHQWLVSTFSGRTVDKNDKQKFAMDEYIESHKALTRIAYLSLEFSPDCGFRTSSEILDLLLKENISHFSSAKEIDQALRMVDVYGKSGNRPESESSSLAVKVVEYPIEEALIGLSRRIRQQHAVVQASETPVVRVTTREMLENGLKVANSEDHNYAVPVSKSIELPEKELPLDPYLMGQWLGEGETTLTNPTAVILEGFEISDLSNNLIPIDYLRASSNQRLSLLQGFVDSKGNVSDDGSIEISFENKELGLQVVQLVRTLGIKSTTVFEKAVVGKNSSSDDAIVKIVFTTNLPFSRLEQNLKKTVSEIGEDSKWNYVTKVEKLETIDSAKCISVGSPDFTYLVGDGFLTTSNSTTIYTALGEVSKPEVNVVTVEDPVEKKIPGISQIQINNKAGMTFSSALRSILRADPDIVFLGEIRDEETAKIAVDASMTGHLVLSTLHTNGAPESASRLIEMGVEPYLVGTSVTCVVAQRLARRLCGDCKEETTIDKETLERVDFPYLDAQLYKPIGCNLCANTGYRGRVALTEVMEITPEIEPFITAQKSANEIRKEAEKHGLVSLREDGYKKVQSGITTIEEVMRVAA